MEYSKKEDSMDNYTDGLTQQQEAFFNQALFTGNNTVTRSLAGQGYFTCIRHGTFIGTSCPNCAQEAHDRLTAFIKRSSNTICDTSKGEDNKMAKVELTSEQKAIIVYARAKGLGDELISLSIILGHNPATIDKLFSILKLVGNYDPSDDDDEDKKDA